jgi:hypothetical protein
MTLECALIGTKGSNDPASKNAKKSQNLAVHYEAKQTRSLANIIIQNPEDVDNPSENPNPSEDESDPTDQKQDDNSSTKKDCGEGKFLNPKTGRCKNLQEITETSTGKTITTYDPETGEPTTVKICNDGYYLNIETNRCNKVKEEKTSGGTKTSSTTTSSTKTCPEGKVLNPKTNRCKNEVTVVESSTGKTITTFDPETGEEKTEKICNEGYELNEETNRCKKKKENDGEDYQLEVPELGAKKEDSFIGLGSIIAVIVIGVGLVIFQFRKEIVKFFKGLKSRKE